jgi:hypothetical protein
MSITERYIGGLPLERKNLLFFHPTPSACGAVI